jgi:hypothetical protein
MINGVDVSPDVSTAGGGVDAQMRTIRGDGVRECCRAIATNTTIATAVTVFAMVGDGVRKYRAINTASAAAAAAATGDCADDAAACIVNQHDFSTAAARDVVAVIASVFLVRIYILVLALVLVDSVAGFNVVVVDD